MDEHELAQTLAMHQGKGYVIAPAGFGKTHLIALAVKSTIKRQLILTHTFAGVNALKHKMRIEGVSPSKYKIDTIASWALRICLSYPQNSKWEMEQPNDDDEWTQLYNSCSLLLSKDFVKSIVRASYAGVYVDEYQDCSISQHNLIMALAELLPCRILGDPLQSIFEFDDEPVNWEKHIFPNCTKLGELITPWRWRKSGANDLGEWLKQARQILENDLKIDLSKNLPANVRVVPVDLNDFGNSVRFRVFYEFIESKDNVIVIFPGTQKNKAHSLARNLKGTFSSIEESEGKALFLFIKKMSNAPTGSAKLGIAIEFAEICMSNIKAVLPAGTNRYEKVKITNATKYPNLVTAANNYHDDPSSLNLKTFWLLLKDAKDVHLYRRDLFYRALQVLNIHIQSPDTAIEDAAIRFQKEFRFNGRPIKHNKLIGTTLLVKGLEFDHAIIVDTSSLSSKEIYVALTRGSKSVTIITQDKTLPQ